MNGNSLATSQAAGSGRGPPVSGAHLEFYNAQHALDADTEGTKWQ